MITSDVPLIVHALTTGCSWLLVLLFFPLPGSLPTSHCLLLLLHSKYLWNVGGRHPVQGRLIRSMLAGWDQEFVFSKMSGSGMSGNVGCVCTEWRQAGNQERVATGKFWKLNCKENMSDFGFCCCSPPGQVGQEEAFLLSFFVVLFMYSKQWEFSKPIK